MKKILFGLCFMFLLAFCGCGEDDIHVLIDNMDEKAESGIETVKEGATDLGEDITYGYNNFVYGSIPTMWYKSCVLLRKWAAVFMVGCILAGLILHEIFRKNMEIRKFALITLCVKLPIILLVSLFIYAFLFGVAYPNVTSMGDASKVFASGFPYAWYMWCKKYQVLANIGIFLSALCGLFLMELFRRSNPDIVAFAKETLIKKIPGIAVLGIDVYAVLFYVFS